MNVFHGRCSEIRSRMTSVLVNRSRNEEEKKKRKKAGRQLVSVKHKKKGKRKKDMALINAMQFVTTQNNIEILPLCGYTWLRGGKPKLGPG